MLDHEKCPFNALMLQVRPFFACQSMHLIMANTLLASRNNLMDIYGDAKVFDIFMLLNISPFAVNVSLFLLILFVSCSLTIIV